MAEHPLLPLPKTETTDRPLGRQFPGNNLKRPPRDRQIVRIGPTFDRLRQTLGSSSDVMSLREDPTSIAPERALVFEVAGSIANFYETVRKIEGLEFLADEETEFEPDEDFAQLDTRRGREGESRMEKMVGGRLYLAMPDGTALKQLLSLWDRWQRGETLERGFTPWSGVFDQLRKLRSWGPQDRIPEETIAYWRAKLEAAPAHPCGQKWSCGFMKTRTGAGEHFSAFRRSWGHQEASFSITRWSKTSATKGFWSISRRGWSNN